MICIKISRNGVVGYYQPLEDLKYAVETEFEYNEIGDTITFEYVEMAPKQYDALPEFEGW